MSSAEITNKHSETSDPLSSNEATSHAISVIEQLAKTDEPGGRKQSTDGAEQQRATTRDSVKTNEFIARIEPAKQFSDFTHNQLHVFMIAVGYGASKTTLTKAEYVAQYNKKHGTNIKIATFSTAFEAALKKLAYLVLVRQKGNPLLPVTRDWLQIPRTQELSNMWEALQMLNEGEFYAGYSLFGAIEQALNKRRRKSNEQQAEYEGDGSEVGQSVFEVLKKPPLHALLRIGAERRVEALTTNDHTVPTMYWELVENGDLDFPEDIPKGLDIDTITGPQKTGEMERLKEYSQEQIVKLCEKVAHEDPNLRRMADKFVGHMRRERNR